MSRLYDETQDFLPDGQYSGEYAMCSVSKRACNEAVKRQNINYVELNTDLYARPHTQVAPSHSFSAEAHRSRRCQPHVDEILRACLSEFLAKKETFGRKTT